MSPVGTEVNLVLGLVTRKRGGQILTVVLAALQGRRLSQSLVSTRVLFLNREGGPLPQVQRV